MIKKISSIKFTHGQAYIFPDFLLAINYHGYTENKNNKNISFFVLNEAFEKGFAWSKVRKEYNSTELLC